MSDINIDEIINIQVQAQSAGFIAFNVSNIGMLTTEEGETPDEKEMLFSSASMVTTEFGTNSIISRMANGAYSQSPNLKAGRGSTVVGKIVRGETSFLENVLTAISGDLILTKGDDVITLTAPFTEQDILDVGFNLVNGRFVSKPNMINYVPTYNLNDGDGAIDPDAQFVEGEDLLEAIIRTSARFSFYGFVIPFEISEEEYRKISDYCQVFGNKKLFVHSFSNPEDLLDTGLIKETSDKGNENTRMLYTTKGAEYGYLFAIRYLSSLVGVNYNASRTTKTMHLKDMIGITGDEGISNAILQRCKLIGADVYAYINGVPKVLTTGANNYSDRVVNKCWFINAIQVAGANVLSTTSTKIPQTEDGVDQLESAYRGVCETAIRNLFAAAGEWNSPDTFGDEEEFKDNIRNFGFYIKTMPLAEQDPIDRDERIAPPCMIAIKEAGAFHSADILVYINA